MDTKNRLGTAIRMAAEVHENQYDKAGEPYILHCLSVMRMAGEKVSNRERVMIVAVLHDALEDFKGSTTDKLQLKDEIYDRFGARVSSAIDALTKRRSHEETYDEYLDRVAGDWMARVVKICDLTHNLDPRRIPSADIGEKDFQRWLKYHRALIKLERE